MDCNSVKICSICQSPVQVDHISYSCIHSYCLKCYPWILFHLLKYIGVNQYLFQNPNQEYSCPICEIGKAKFPFESLFREFKLENSVSISSKNKEEVCFACEKVPEKICIDCEHSFCMECLRHMHKPKKMQSHQFKNWQKEEKKCEETLPLDKTFKCLCPTRENITEFCLKCQKSMCPSCKKNEHQDHKPQTPIEKVMFLPANIEESKTKINDLLKNFTEIGGKLLEKMITSKKTYNEKFDNMIDDLISQLKLLKIQNNDKSCKNYQFLSSQLSLIQSSLIYIRNELSQSFPNFVIHPTKQFFIQKLFNNFEVSKSYIFKNIENMSVSADNVLEDMQQIMTNIKTKYFSHNNILTVLADSEIQNEKETKLDTLYKNFKSNPLNFFSQYIYVTSGKFNCFWSKSRCSCSFLINNETFIAYSGLKIVFDFSKSKNIIVYPLMIYNVSLAENQVIPQENNVSSISFVATYPKDDVSYFKKKWLYYGTASGLIQIYDISSDKSFKLKHSIKVEGEINSAIIFQDKFNELGEPSADDMFGMDEFSNLYIMITLSEESNKILIYKKIREYDEDSYCDKWEPFREFSNTEGKSNECGTIDFYSDETNKKMRFLLGLSSSYIGIYDLKANFIEETELETKNEVTSLNFFSLKKNPKDPNCTQIDNFLIYTQYNETLIVGDLNTRKIIRKKDFEEETKIFDCCVWNARKTNSKSPIYILIAKSKPNSIQVLDFENLNVLFIRENYACPINLTKFLQKQDEAKEESYEEELAFFAGSGDSSEFMIAKKAKDE